ncbi:Putative DNA-binding protein in cluster with Type I restriction-modification system [uncultured Candidatus Thioglobus sp.]|nr:Putative DNA-binding protein in cluster with Type I restriction-modification system [uncultured Candidatus Thioglobus sp.]
MTTNSQIILYKTQTGEIKIDVRLEDDTVWLNRHQLSNLFDRDIKTIGKHIGNIFKEGELSENSVVANFATTATDDKIYQIDHYNLEMIIALGYRVKSPQGTQFRIWAIKQLKEYISKGFVLDDERFKAGGFYVLFR